MNPDPAPVPHTAVPPVPPVQEGTTGGWPPGALTFIAEYEPILYRMARRGVGDPELARDLVQDAFLRFFRKTYPPHALYTILRNLIKDWHRRRRMIAAIWPGAPPALESVPDGSPDPLAQAVARDEHERLTTALRQFPVETAVILLRYAAGERTREIAADMGLRHGAVRTRIHRAVEKLRAILE